MHVKANYTFLYLRGITARHQDELFSRSNQELRAIGLDVTPHLSDCTPPSISVIEHSADELKLLDYLISQRAMIRDFACQLPLPVGQLVISKTRALVFDTHDESCGYVLKSHLGAYVNDAMEWPPWFVHNNTFGAPLHLLKCQQGDRCFPKFFGHPFLDFSSQALLAPNVSKVAMEQLQLKGLGFETVAPVVSYEEATDNNQPDEYIFAQTRFITRRFRNIAFGSYPSELPPWWVLLPFITLPPMHPLLIRRKYLIRDAVIDDSLFRGPVHVFSKHFDGIPPIYTPEALAAMPAFDVAMTFEHRQFGRYSGQLVVSERGKELLSPYLVEPHWARVGILPANSPVLGGSG